MVTPRFAINVFAIGGVVFIVVGAFLAFLTAVPAVGDGAPWLVLMGLGFVLIGVPWMVLLGRWGRLAESARAARGGVDGTAVLADLKYTSASQSSGEHGPTTHQVMRLDFDVSAPTIATYRVRVYRKLRVGLLPHVRPGLRLPVRVHADRPDLLALTWPASDWPAFHSVQAGARVEAVAPAQVAGRAVYTLVVSVPGSEPFRTTIEDRGPANPALIGRDLPVTVGSTLADVHIVWST